MLEQHTDSRCILSKRATGDAIKRQEPLTSANMKRHLHVYCMTQIYLKKNQKIKKKKKESKRYFLQATSHRHFLFCSLLGRPLLSGIFINFSAAFWFPYWCYGPIAAVWSAIQVTSAFNGWFIRAQQELGDVLQDKEPVLNYINTLQ